MQEAGKRCISHGQRGIVQPFFVLDGSAKPKIQVRDKRCHQHPLLRQAFCFRLDMLTLKKEHFTHHMAFLLQKINLLQPEMLSDDNDYEKVIKSIKKNLLPF